MSKKMEKTKRIKPFLGLVIAAVLVVQYMQLDESKKRFIKHLAKQAPYLPGRYYA
jgi:hypothetical protein